MTELVGPPVLKVDIEGWSYLSIRADLVPLLLALGHYHRRSGIPAGSDLEQLLTALERRSAECGSAHQPVAASGKALEAPASKVFTVKEVGSLAGASTRTIRGLAGVELPGRRTSAGWLLEADGVERWLATRAEYKGA